MLRWEEPTPDDVSRMPTNIDATLVGEESNPTTLLLMAHICAALDSVPEWLQWVQAPDTLSAAGAAGVHSWGLMLPTSTRTPGLLVPTLQEALKALWAVISWSSGRNPPKNLCMPEVRTSLRSLNHCYKT